MINPYYQRDGITIYLGDCRWILPSLMPGMIITDPPYPDYLTEVYQQTPIDFLNDYHCKQVVFWSAKVDFPLDYTAIHIWDKKMGVASEYERIFERNGQKNYKLFSHCPVASTVAAQMTRDIFTGHPSQKPTALMLGIITKLGGNSPIVDPFMGSGATLEAAYRLGYEAIGIEAKEEYCKMAVKRLSGLPIRIKAIHQPEQLCLMGGG